VSAHVTDMCAIDKPVTLGIIGCGVQAREQLRAVRAVRPIREVRVYSRTRGAADVWAQELRADLTEDARILVADDVVQTCEGADVIATATTSTQPLFSAGTVMLEPHVHMNCMGAHTEHSRELPIELLRSSTLVVEDRETAAREAGDVHANALELGHLEDCSRRLRQERTVFSSTGHISTDACLAAALIEQIAPHRERGGYLDSPNSAPREIPLPQTSLSRTPCCP
jgi:ornithine cyclodeaminase/alanine dehydrogenase-like protein (mu-crystallin family)